MTLATFFVWSLWPWLAAASAVFGIGLFILAEDDLSIPGICAASIGALGFLILTAIGFVVPRVQAYDHRQCTRWGASTEREVKWVRYSVWSYDCMVRTSDGRWITRDSVIEVGGKVTS